jgi:hypothetical protein
MNLKTTPPLVKKNTPSFPKMTRPARSFLESLESRIAPAGLAGITYIDVTLGTPQLLTAGHGLKANGVYLMAVTQGEALIYTTDVNGSNKFDYNDITGISAGNGLKLTSFVNINGDIVTNLQANGTLSNSDGSNPTGHDGLLLLNSTIDAITLRSLTAADVPAGDNYLTHLAPSNYSINGNIYAGGGIGDGAAGDGIVIDTAGTAAQVAAFNGIGTPYYQVSGVTPYIGAVKTGTAAGGNSFSFGYYSTTTTNPNHVAGDLQEGGTLKPYTPGVGVAGGNIIGISAINSATASTTTGASPVPFTINGIVAGDGGIGANGGSISNVALDGDSGGLRIQAGNGGDGSKGGNGGSITNLSDVGSGSVEGLVQIKTGSGGEGFLGAGGAAGTLSLGQFSMNGNINFDLGNGGNALGNAGPGASISTGTLTPTDAGGFASAVAVVTTYRAAGDIGTPKLIDFNNDGYADEVFMTNSPDQLGIVFGSAAGITNASPVLYLAVPGLNSLDTSTSAITVGDFNGATYPDGTPILDIAVASSLPNNNTGISVFMNPGNDPTTGVSIWGTEATSTTGGNFIDSSLHSTLPNLVNQGFLASGGAITNLVTGDFNGAVYPIGSPHAGQPIMGLAYTQQVYYYNGSIQPATTAVVLDGTGDGHFFANFSYNSITGTDTKMPVLNGGTEYLGHGQFELKATAAQAGNAASDVLVLAGIPTTGDGFVALLQDVSGHLQGYGVTPTYATADFDKSVIIGFSSYNATPIDIAITTGITRTGFPADSFDVVVLDAGNAVSLFSGSFTGDFTMGTGVASMNETSGVTLVGNDTLLGTDSKVDFKGIVAGSFGGADPTQFALYTNATANTAFYTFNVYHGGLFYSEANLTYDADLQVLTSIGDQYAPATGNYDGAIVAFGLYNNDATSTLGATSYAPLVTAGTTFGYIAAKPTSNGDGYNLFDPYLIGGVGTYAVNHIGGMPVIVNQGLIDYAIQIAAGSGGNSDLGAGGAGGSIGNGSLTGTTASITVTLPVIWQDQPFVTLVAGDGGNGLTSGGNGGSLSGLRLQFDPTATTLSGGFTLVAAQGGTGFFGKGGNGGSLSTFQAQRGSNFVAGDGGSGYQGGNGGTINGTSGTAGYTTYESEIYLVAGNGGSGVVSGGTGGNITGFAPLFPPPNGGSDIGFNGGYLSYTAGAGGSAMAGAGGTGGSVISSSPISTTNYLGGEIVIQSGEGGNGLSGGTGGSVSNFTNQSTAASAVSEISILAGNGGTGITGNGGAGGSISSVSASSGRSDPYYGYNRIIAGEGGFSYGATGGAGGNLNSVNSTAGSTAEVLVAGNGGDGLARGGLGGSVSNSYGNAANSSTSKLLVIAGAGGNAYGAVYATDTNGDNLNNIGIAGDTNAVILALRAFGAANGIGGNGGSITNFSQQVGTQVAVDLIAGNGGSVFNYGNAGYNTSNVGKGGSMSTISIVGTVGRINPNVAIQTYGYAGTSVQDFVQNVLRDSPFVSLTDSGYYGGNVGAILGSAGILKAGVAEDQGGSLPATDSVAKTGSVSNFSAGSIMSMVAGSVDNIAAINTITAISLTGTDGVYGAYKTNPIPQQTTPVLHDNNNPLYFDTNGNEVSSPLIGGSLMDGAVIALTKPTSLTGTRIF